MALMLLCEFILNSTQAPPGEKFLYHTLLELHLMGDDDQPPQLPQTTPNSTPTGTPTDAAPASTQGSPADLAQQADQVSLLIYRNNDITQTCCCRITLVTPSYHERHN